jgi:hypothetical protein
LPACGGNERLVNEQVQGLLGDTHDAARREATTKDDYSREDRVDPEEFNQFIWLGLMGTSNTLAVRRGSASLSGKTPQSRSFSSSQTKSPPVQTQLEELAAL